MVNNAIDHSGGTRVTVTVETTAATTTLWIADDGVGIFRKIQAELGLEDERHVLLAGEREIDDRSEAAHRRGIFSPPGCSTIT